MTEGWEVLLLLAALVAAAGVDLPLLLLLPWLLGLLPGAQPLPHGLEALASPAPAALGATLFVLGHVFRGIPGVRGAWELIHSLAALPTAALLVYLAEPTDLVPGGRLPWAGLAILMVAILQGARLGARVLDRIAPPGTRKPAPAAREALEDAAVLLLVAGSTFASFAAGVGGILLVGFVAVAGRSALRATRFLPTLLRGVLRDLGGSRGWRSRDRVPGWVRAGAGEASLGSGFRAAPAGLVGAPDTGGFRRGWLLAGPGTPCFLYRTPARVWEMDLASARVVEVDSRPWAVRVCLDLDRSRPVLVVPRDGPGPEGGFGFPPRSAEREENL